MVCNLQFTPFTLRPLFYLLKFMESAMPRKRISVLILILSLCTGSLSSYGEDENLIGPIDTAILNYLAPRGETQVTLYHTGAVVAGVGGFVAFVAGMKMGDNPAPWRKHLSRRLLTAGALSLSTSLGFFSLADESPGGC